MRLLLATVLLAACSSSSAPSEELTQAPVRAAKIETARAPALPQRPQPSAALAADLVDANPNVRRAAIKEARADADPAVLLAASRDSDLSVGVLATEALGQRYAKGELPVGELIARATDPSLNDRVRVTALNGLGVISSPDAANLLTDLLARGTQLERGSAAILLQHQDPELAIPALIRALADADETVRANVLESLRARSRGRDFGSDAGAWTAWWQSRPR